MAIQALISAADVPLPFLVPWREVLLTITILPALVYVVSYCFSTGQQAFAARAGQPTPS